MDFISYSRGPLPEELLGDIKVPVVIGWGDQDPWEPIGLGRAYAAFDSVEVNFEYTLDWLRIETIEPIDTMGLRFFVGC